MIKKINALLMLMYVFNGTVFAKEQCNTQSLESYKNAIKTYEKNDFKLKKIPEGASFLKPDIKNCYVSLTMVVKGFNEYDRVYLFDPQGVLVNVKPSAGQNIMTCKDSVRKNIDYFDKLLAKKRTDNKILPLALANKTKSTITVRNCLISFYERFQDAQNKPLLYREWVFDHNENIVFYGDIERFSKIYPE